MLCNYSYWQFTENSVKYYQTVFSQKNIGHLYSRYFAEHLNNSILLPTDVPNAGLMANSVDPDQMQRSVASDEGLHCLPRPVCKNTSDYYNNISTFFGLFNVFRYSVYSKHGL